MDDLEHSFAAQLRQYRLRAGLTQDALAERAGLTTSAIASLERNRRRHPYPHTLRLLAAALALSDDELVQFNLLALSAESRVGVVEPPISTDIRRTNMPVPRTSLIGREGDIAALVELIPRHLGRLVTLTGIGGGGKTRLALAVAAELQNCFADGVWFVELATIEDAALVPQALAAALGVPEVADTPLRERLAQTLRTRSLLLVLDNCEHVAAVCAELAERLLAACPGLRILATSREPLQVVGERQWRVPALALPDPDRPAPIAELALCPAVQLFVERARSIDADFRLTEHNSEAVAAVCGRLGGIPLALELAAARVRVLTVAQILERLDDSLRLLSGNSRAAPTRHQTLRATLVWSHDLLSPAEQTLFHRLAVFVNGCDIAAVEAVCTGADLQAEEMLDLLTRLVDKSLVVVSVSTEATRYRLLEPTRQFASGFATPDERATTRERHAAWYRALADAAATQLRGPAQVEWLARLEREQGNLRAALRWANEQGAIEFEARLAVAMASFWEAHTYLSEGRRVLAMVLDGAGKSIDGSLRRSLLLAAGRLAQWQADLDEAEALLQECLALARVAAAARDIAAALAWLGVVQMRRQRFVAAAELLEESLPLFRELRDRPGIGIALLTLGTTRTNQSDFQRARVLLEECLQIYRDLGDVRYAAMARTMLATVYHHTGDGRQAAVMLQAGLQGHLQVGDRIFLVQCLREAALITAARRPRQAARLLGAADGLRAILGAGAPPTDHASDERVKAVIRVRISAAELAAALAEGHSLSLEQAAAEAKTATAQGAAPEVALAELLPISASEALTPREQEIARLLAQGYTNRQIATTLTIAVSTVGVHVHRILAKLGLHSRWQLAGQENRHPGADSRRAAIREDLG